MAPSAASLLGSDDDRPDRPVPARRAPSVKLSPGDAAARLVAHDHGVLSTLHPVRGVDTVPVVYAVAGDRVGMPVDEVKPKSSSRLQRVANLEADPRATLLVDHWDREDWSQLWWVRAGLRWDPDGDVDTMADRLAGKYAQYRDRPFTRILVFDLVDLRGWAAGPT